MREIREAAGKNKDTGKLRCTGGQIGNKVTNKIPKQGNQKDRKHIKEVMEARRKKRRLQVWTGIQMDNWATNYQKKKRLKKRTNKMG